MKSKPRNSLTRREARLLENYIEANWNAIKEGGYSYESFATVINKTKIPGLEDTKVAPGNIKGAVFALGLEWTRVVGKHAGNGQLGVKARLQQLENKQQETETLLESIRKDLDMLLDNMTASDNRPLKASQGILRNNGQ